MKCNLKIFQKYLIRRLSGKSWHVDFSLEKPTRQFLVEKADTSGLNFFLY